MTDEVGAVIEETEPAVLLSDWHIRWMATGRTTRRYVGEGMREELRSRDLSARLMRPDSA